MPYLEIKTSIEPSGGTAALLSEANAIVADVLGKSPEFCMSSAEVGVTMAFGQTNEPCAFLSLRAIGLGDAHCATLSFKLCELLHQCAEIPIDRCYIQFTNVERSYWGWNGTTFGAKG